MSLWQHLNESERIAAIQTTAADKHIEDRAVEKDWWVTAVLNALFRTSCRDYLLFKGGTSISKGWIDETSQGFTQIHSRNALKGTD